MFEHLGRSLIFAFLATSTAFGALAACSDGSTDNPSSCPNDLPQSCPSPPPSWANDVQPIIANRCWSCHGDGGAVQVFFDYTTYQGVYQNRAQILRQVYGCLMPPADASPPAPPPTLAERQTLLGWLVCDAPDN